MQGHLIGCLLVGAGKMADDYLKVLQRLGVDTTVICQSSESASKFEQRNKHAAIFGGLESYLSTKKQLPPNAIVAVNIEKIFSATIALLEAGVSNILIEKPAALKSDEIRRLAAVASEKGARLYVGYNRRFYASIEEVRRLVVQEGGVLSCAFDFTEATNRFDPFSYPYEVREHWGLANSTHILDLIFHIIGPPKTLECSVHGALDWHHSGGIFVGSGISTKEVPFSYHSDWLGPGRWRAEFVLRTRKLLLQPIEILQESTHQSFDLKKVRLDYTNDEKFKPGILNQVRAFLGSKVSESSLCSISEHAKNFAFYERVFGYT